LSLVAVDAAGAPVVSVDSLTLRPVAAATAAGSALQKALFSVEWIAAPLPAPAASGQLALVGPDGLGLAERLDDVSVYADLAALAAAIEAGGPVPAAVLARVGGHSDDADEGARARRVTGEALELAQQWPALESTIDSRLIVVTRGAVAVRPGETVADLGAAAARGLLRSAQSEHPGRLILVDLPAQDDTDVRTLLSALDTAEPEIAIRGDAAYVRRLARPPAPATSADSGDRTPGAVLVTGGTGTLAGVTAHHLALTGRAAQLILVSRSGPPVPPPGPPSSQPPGSTCRSTPATSGTAPHWPDSCRAFPPKPACQASYTRPESSMTASSAL